MLAAVVTLVVTLPLVALLSRAAVRASRNPELVLAPATSRPATIDRAATNDRRDADAPLAPSDIAEMSARLDHVVAHHAAHRDALLEIHLRPLVERRVPVRCIEPLEGLRTTRIRFADGTAVVGRGVVAGDTGVLALVLRDHSVLAGTCSTDAEGTHLVFDWSGGRRPITVLVTGLDQPE